MKQKRTVMIDRELVLRAKRFARERGVSVSSLIEEALREMTADAEDTSFSGRWRGRLVLAEHDEARFQALIEKYG